MNTTGIKIIIIIIIIFIIIIIIILAAPDPTDRLPRGSDLHPFHHFCGEFQPILGLHGPC
jgi:amino acid permease